VTAAAFYPGDRYAAHRDALRAAGVDPGDIVWHLATRDDLLRVVSSLVPNRFTHWTFAERYLRSRASAGRLYEFVVWDDPPVAYVDQTLSAAEVDLIVPHVMGHAAVMRYNRWLGPRWRLTADQWAAHAHWVDRELSAWAGEAREATPKPESVAWSIFRAHVQTPTKQPTTVIVPPWGGLWTSYDPLDLLLTLDPATLAPWERAPEAVVMPWQRRPPAETPAWRPPVDLALAALGRATWAQVDVLDLLRTTAAAPRTRTAAAWYQQEVDVYHAMAATKTLNEGYATYWHRRRGPVTERGAWEQAALRCGVERAHPANPYWLGAAVFEAAADPHGLMRRANDATLLAQGLTPAVRDQLRLIPARTDPDPAAPGWIIRHDAEDDPTRLAWHLQLALRAQWAGGIGAPRWAWRDAHTLALVGQWGVPDLVSAAARPLTVEVGWLLGIATLLGRPITVEVPGGVTWAGGRELPTTL